ncbi:peptidoglycan-binding protein LysM [Chryseobacterium culicis]|uniref:Peptidoglycan-binding protein LysM n=1 Tax=Chryseobacterium culicis TaxID=680127 RepID=A0A2S9CZM8_CHRCI|nr:peptidoglycan-binding protein LysM [Chryseobacterium culicis]PRB85977.1 peptidoglycan-binding protein LysM [Chryseobacterium culicis]PRB91730.1 peptidoglycan-binding protein LysM [Chryseobacterium culicis]
MKKQIFIIALSLGAIALGTNQVMAQNSEQVSTSVNIILSDVIAMDIGSVASEGTVDFNYGSTKDYNSSKNVTVPNSLVIISSKNFDVKVKSEGTHFVSGANVIPVDILQVKAIPGGSLVGTLNEVTLSTTDQVLVSNASLGTKQSVNIAYSISAENASKVLLGKPQGTYTQKITYTATAL